MRTLQKALSSLCRNAAVELLTRRQGSSNPSTESSAAKEETVFVISKETVAQVLGPPAVSQTEIPEVPAVPALLTSRLL